MMTLDKFPISGRVAPGFEPVRTTFEKNFATRGEFGAAIHVTVDGAEVVDLWGGVTDLAGTCPWHADTLVNVWSSTKGLLALAMHMLAERGLLDFDAPVAYYWPEFAQKGKGSVLVRHILTHTAGLPAPSMKVPDESVYDWDVMIHALEQSELYWLPGTKCGYHAATFGWLNGEVLKRITGMSVGKFLRSQIAGPLGADAFIGLSSADQARTADMIPPHPLEAFLFRVATSLGGRAKAMAFNNPPRRPKAANTPLWREVEIPSSNGHASARGLARMYAPLALGGKVDELRLLSEAGVELAGREQVHARDIVTGTLVRRTLGFTLPSPELGDPRPLTAFGHPGMGGSIGFADPPRRLAMGYVMNKMIIGLDSRYGELCRAVYSCLGNRFA
ncbi:MAG: serine hydrolase domain-containing protein [Anaerolineales bacterium]|jgi:CubicO group peptidase (beta-lactamase class C family)